MKRLLVPLLLLFAHPAFPADNELLKCRQIENVVERAACYDEIVDARLGAKTDRSPDAQSLFGTDDAEAKRIVEETLAIEQIDRIEAKVADVMDSSGRRMVLTLDNGQTWRQLDNKTLHLESGEPVIVRKASLGSYLLEKASGSRPIRVKRVD